MITFKITEKNNIIIILIAREITSILIQMISNQMCTKTSKVIILMLTWTKESIQKKIIITIGEIIEIIIKLMQTPVIIIDKIETGITIIM